MDRLMIESQIGYCQEKLLRVAVIKQHVENHIEPECNDMLSQELVKDCCNSLITSSIEEIKYYRKLLKE